MSLYSVCEWLEATSFGTALRESSLMFPLVEGTHLLALGLSVGTVAISDLRLLGVTLKQDPVSDIFRQLMPWTLGGFVVMFVTGSLLFWAEPVRVYTSPWFRLKLLFIVMAALNALVYHVTIHRRLADWDRHPVPPARARVAGFLSLLLWALVIAAGRTTAYKL